MLTVSVVTRFVFLGRVSLSVFAVCSVFLGPEYAFSVVSAASFSALRTLVSYPLESFCDGALCLALH